MSHNQNTPQSGSSTGRETDKDSLIREIESNFRDDQFTVRVEYENRSKPEDAEEDGQFSNQEDFQ